MASSRSTIELFIAEILGSPLLTPKEKDDAHKVLHCVCHIQKYIDRIVSVVDHKNDSKLYRNARDQKNGVLRDDNGTSFHLNSYKSSQEAKESLTRFIEQLTTAIQSLSTDNRLEFAKKFSYDRKVGCLEARMSNALQWAAIRASGNNLPLLDDIMQACVKKRGNQPILIDRYAEQYCREEKITHCLYQGKTVEINAVLLRRYAKEILCEDEQDDVKQALLAKEAKRDIKQSVADTKHDIKGMQRAKESSYAIYEKLEPIKKKEINAFLSQLSKVQIDYAANPKDYKDSKDFKEAMVFFRKTSTDVINLAFILKYFNRFFWMVSEEGEASGFQRATMTPSILFEYLISRASVDSIDQALILQSVQNKSSEQFAGIYVFRTGLSFAIAGADPDVIHQLITKASPEGLSKALVWQDPRAYWESDQRVKVSTFQDVMMKQLPTPIISALIAKVSAASITQALVLQGSNKNSGLLTAICYADSDVVSQLIAKASREGLSKVCMLINDERCTILDYANAYLTPQMVAVLLNKIDDNALRYLLTHSSVSPRTAAAITSNIIYEPSWQVEPLLSRMFNIIGSKIAVLCQEAYLQGKDIPAGALKASIPYLEKLIQSKERPANFFELKETLPAWIKLVNDEKKRDEKGEEKRDEKSVITTVTGKQIVITTQDEKELRQLFSEGLRSPEDYRLLKRLAPVSIACQIADDLRRANRLYTGTQVPLDLSQYERAPQRYLNVIQQGNAIFKVITNKDWPDFEKQIGDYTYRPKLRAKEIDRSKQKHKFVHREDKTVDYTYHRPSDKKKVYFATKKQSATLLSKKLSSTVFGEQHPDNRILVGVLADIGCQVVFCTQPLKEAEIKPNAYILQIEEKGWKLSFVDDNKKIHPFKMLDDKKESDKKYVHDCLSQLDAAIRLLPKKPINILSPQEKAPLEKIIFTLHERRINKALLTYDRGTFGRSWVSDDKKAVEEYRRKAQQLNCVNFEQFRSMVDENPHRLNEVLTKFTRGNLLAIFITRDTPEARKEARSRQQALKKAHHLDLPIVFYDRALRQTRVYSPREQRDDERGFNAILRAEEVENAETEAKIKTIELLGEIKASYPAELKKAQGVMDNKDEKFTAKLSGLEKIIDNEQCRQRLHNIKKFILAKPSWKLGLFSAPGKILPEEMKQLLHYIAEADAGRSSYRSAHDNVKLILGKSHQKGSEDVRRASEEAIKMMEMKAARKQS